jgi:glycosyltransferase involved in cell wall biosynthesis
MRIAFISYEYPPDTAFGGIGTYIYNISRILAARGHDVVVITGSHEREGVTEENGVKVHRAIEKKRNDFAILAAHIFRQLHKTKPFDVVEGPEFCADARRITEEYADVPYVLSMHTPSKLSARLNQYTGFFNELRKATQDVWRLINYFFGRIKSISSLESYWGNTYLYMQERIEMAEAKKADLITVPSRSLGEYIETKWGIEYGKIQHVPNAFIPEESFTAIPIGLNGHDNGEVVLGFIGRLQYRKGVNFLVKALKIVLQNHPEIRFKWIGSIQNEPKSKRPYDEWIQKELKEYNQQIEIKGRVPFKNIAGELEQIDVIVLPSVWENFPYTCLESMSAGRAIIASKEGGMSEMLNGGECGILVDPKDYKELASSMNRLIEDPELRNRLGKRARERVIEEYSTEKIGRRKEELFEIVIDKAR